MKKIRDLIFNLPVTMIAVVAVCLNIIIEVLNRGSFMGLLSHIVTSPLTFVANTVIIMFTLSIALLFKKRIFATALIAVLWITLGIANSFTLVSGNMPLTVCHIFNFGSAIKLSSLYMTLLEVVLVFVGIIAVLVGGVILWKRTPKTSRNIKKSLLSISALFTVCAIIVLNTSAQTPDFSDLQKAYEKYGFAYCFSYSVLNIGIEMPEDYSPEAVSRVLDKIDIEDTEPTVKPNIIFVQLESFFDVKTLKETNFSDDPVPNFTRLKEEYPSGYLEVSSIGGGTSNTEFEIMTGMSLEHFGIGEYPYLTFLAETPCESVMRNLAEYGYTSTAMHSYTGTFYQRHRVFKNLGFDRFISEEFLTVEERNEIGWVKDKTFLRYIRETLTATEEPDFFYAITVQAHGKYMTEESENGYLINSDYQDSDIKPQMDYYVNEIKEVDDFIGALIEEYESFEEPTVIVLYGDHLPALKLQAEDLEVGNIYKTEYIIWSNFGLEAEDKDLEANMLSAHVTSLLGLTNGYINKLNTYCAEDEDFKQDSKVLAYDLIYGENFANAKTLLPTDMTMGLGLIKVSDCYFEGNDLIVKGEEFNPFSKVAVDGSVKNNTVFIDENTLKVENLFTFSDTAICVVQATSDGTVLGETDVILCKEQNPFIKAQNEFKN